MSASGVAVQFELVAADPGVLAPYVVDGYINASVSLSEAGFDGEAVARSAVQCAKGTPGATPGCDIELNFQWGPELEAGDRGAAELEVAKIAHVLAAAFPGSGITMYTSLGHEDCSTLTTFVAGLPVDVRAVFFEVADDTADAESVLDCAPNNAQVFVNGRELRHRSRE